MNGRKSILEDYLHKEELSNEIKKEKLRKKRCRKREKRKEKKNNSNKTEIEENYQKNQENRENRENRENNRENHYKLHISDDKVEKKERFIDEIPEKEREFLVRMGWEEEGSDEEIEEFELNIVRRSEIAKERESFRKKVSEKFMKMIKKS